MAHLHLRLSYAVAVRLCLVAAAMPPTLDGIGDYTAKLAVYLARKHAVLVATPQPHNSALDGVVVSSLADVRWRGLRELRGIVTQFSCDWLVLQYNPFSYGRWGFAPLLPRHLEAIRRASGCRLAVMVHEPYVEAKFFRDAVMSTWQRWQLTRLVAISDVTFASIEAWTRRIQSLQPQSRAIHLPVASNIDRILLSREHARTSLGIDEREFVMTMFGRAHPSKDLVLAASAVAAVAGRCPVAFQYVGPDSEAVRRAFFGCGAKLIATGPVAEADVSRSLAATDLALLPFTDGISTRRTTLMSALQHGLPILGTVGRLTDGILREAERKAFWLTPAGDTEAYASAAVQLQESPSLRQELGAAGESLYLEEFDWPVLAARLVGGLSEAHLRDQSDRAVRG